MKTADFDYDLPDELIAQKPAAEREQSRLLVVERATGKMIHQQFTDLPGYLRAGDVLVLNNSRVIPARLRGVNKNTAGRFEMLLLEDNGLNDWWAMMKPGRRARIGTEVQLTGPRGEHTGIFATVQDVNDEGHRRLQFFGTKNIFDELERLGEVPLPPYIERAGLLPDDLERYQTVYATPTHGTGSVAAPTAGLHFSVELLEEIKQRGVKICYVTLHVGLGTFAPVKAETLSEHVMHEERFEMSEETAREIISAKNENRRVIAVGTTTVRVLETLASRGAMAAGTGRTRIFIFPPYNFQIVDGLVTNFHLPKSTLLMLVSAFASPGATNGREVILRAYDKAISERYRFFSYGDAMFIA